MHYQGLFWSAIIRSLLSLRRDARLSDSRDDSILDGIALLEQGQITVAKLETMLQALCPENHMQTIGRSLIGYFDFHKMSNLVVLLTASKNIDDALQVLERHASYLLGNHPEFTVSSKTGSVCLSFNAGPFPYIATFRGYFLFSLFRHLAGRHFDFEVMTLSTKNDALMALFTPLSTAEIKYDAQQISLQFEDKWRAQPSFYYSLQIKKMLEPTLEANPQDAPLKQQIRDVFQRVASPARIRAEWVAGQLGQTESSFRRVLRQQSISFSALLKEFIHDQSCQLLLTGVKTDDAAFQLGFSDRRSFERSFKEHAGISAGQLRQLGSRLRFQKGNSSLLDVVENLPPLPNTIQTLLAIPEEQLTLSFVISLIGRDPIFQAHVMSKASRAAYGTPPKNLEQAIGRNLGLSNIKHLTVVFAAQQLLSTQCRFRDISHLTDGMLLSLTLFERLFTFSGYDEQEQEEIKQLLLFGTLSLFLLFHDECIFADGALVAWEKAERFAEFVHEINGEYGLCLYGATSLMLLRWGFNSSVNQKLWKICGTEPDMNNLSLMNQIFLCHDLAFTVLALHHESADKIPLAGFGEEQASIIRDTVERWLA